MESSPLQRRLAFGLIVFALVGLGAYLIGPAALGAGQPAPPRPRHTAGPRPSSPSNPSSPSSSPSPAGSPAPAGTGADIYQWLPFTQASLGVAASVARRFGDAYGTFSYAESPATYAASLQASSSASLDGQIEAAYALPGVAAARLKARQVSAGSVVLESIRAFGPTSITFIVQITQHLMADSGSSEVVTSYAITLTGGGSTWQVTDIELALLGNS